VGEDRLDEGLAVGDVVGRGCAVAGDEQAALGGAAVDEARAGRRRGDDPDDVVPGEPEPLSPGRPDGAGEP
jgi:hypothetical protein